MKKWCLFLSIYMMACLMAACGAGVSEKEAGSIPASNTPEVIRCRVIQAEEDGTLLLAETEGSGVYTLSWEDAQAQSGDIIEIGYGGDVMESYPAQLGGVTWVEVLEEGRDTLCGLYLQALEDLWETDSGLNSGISIIGMDLSQTSLSESERSAVAWAFASHHEAELVEGTWQALCDQGYIDGENLYWEDGCHFSITETPMEGTYSLQTVQFTAEKWRSGLGAYWFGDCTSVQAQNGEWGEYQVGVHVIS